MLSIYQLKSRFQDLLRPSVRRLYQRGVTANQVTLLAMVISLLLGGFLCLPSLSANRFFLLPIWMFLRMAFNAIDGMLAREFKQQSRLGAYLNELSDVIADAALFLPFALLVGIDPALVLGIIFLASLSEFAGVLGLMVGASRRYDGPMGKSDRAFVFGLLATLWPLNWLASFWFNTILVITLLLLLITIINRVRRGLAESIAHA
ncbi:CDP-alcohol phosphatidyltransferase family protein [Vibrio anguillarum]|nr:CDP-alcohol phosphatidyltransferase family protein [Vibrio anguillarum]MBF4278210.1 CDP-alcohol phosphatidyltransferase family protein [Vibrio anguillarum]MBF4298805.1 CDP-alcohol phosphatidyltransferase family protein [Vibrio anguillarum]MBF4334922.1 CDP-alcohol phosphatidyltransferase family protein [Vibrio anguillarum]MBF4359866.1 CDP-alcohol phosphatidyltransferase family protein [Vibrio anguillarum]